METFIVLQAIWDTFLIFLAAVGLSVIDSFLACLFMSEEEIEDFLNKYGI